MENTTTVDISRNEKQKIFWRAVKKEFTPKTQEGYRIFMFGGAIRGGKLLPLDTPIPTPNGWTTIGELKIGDEVIDCYGEITEVCWVSEIEENPNAYELSLDDGSKIICDEGHQWVTTTFKDRVRLHRSSDEFREKRKQSREKKGKGKKPWLSARNSNNAKLLKPVPDERGTTKTTKEIVDTLKHGKYSNHAIVNCGELNLPKKKLLIQPYTLGAWLGDGTSSSIGLTGIDSEVWEEIEKEGYTVTHHKDPKSHNISNLTAKLKKLNLLNNKHIPQVYLRGSIEQRLALLQGLCDTDGYCCKQKGSVEFTTTNEKIKDGFLELVYSLGIKPSCREGISKLNGVEFGKKWRIQFWYENPCFRIKRKAERQKLTLGKTRHYRTIIDAKSVPPVPMKCIAVNAPSHTYLCGKEMIPTHNTYVCLFILVMLCKIYKGSRWVVVRETGTSLQATTIPSLKKILKFTRCKWSSKAGDKYVEFPNGSRIIFMAEMFNSDKELDRFKGLECNGFLLEQVEELQEQTFMKCIERSGSWYDCEMMPPPFVFATFNPTFNWVKTKIYDTHKLGKLLKPYYFLEAFPKDNPFVTEEQWRQWELLDDISKALFIEGLWEVPIDGTFFHEFKSAMHIRETPFIPAMDLLLSFDFNVDPMTCIAAQIHYDKHDRQRSFVRVLKEYRIKNSDTYRLCDEIIADWSEYNPYYVVTGDASGKNRQSATFGAINHYDIIQNKLGLKMQQIRLLNVNPGISESRTFCNSILKHVGECSVNPMCEYLIKDLRFVETMRDKDGKLAIKKTGINKYASMSNEEMTHLGDTFRYLLHAFMTDWIKIHRS